MESQKRQTEDGPVEVNAGTEPNPATQSIDIKEVAHAGVRPSGAAASKNPPQIPLAPMKRVQARFNPLADTVMYVVVFAGGFFGVGCRRVLDMLMPSIGGTPFVVGTFVSNMIACFLFAMLVEYMATASWLRRRVRQVVSRGVGLGFLGGLSTMSGVMLETMEGLHEQRFAAAFGYLAASFVCGLIASAAGMALMRVVTSHGTRKRVRAALASASVSDSGESDIHSNVRQSQMSDSPESDTQGGHGVRHVKVADVAHSAAQAALEAAQTAQQAAQIAQQAAQAGSISQVDSVAQAGPDAQQAAQPATQSVSRDVSRDILRLPVPQLDIPQLSVPQLQGLSSSPSQSQSSSRLQSQASSEPQPMAHDSQTAPQRADLLQSEQSKQPEWFAQPEQPAQPERSAYSGQPAQSERPVQPQQTPLSQQTPQPAQPHQPSQPATSQSQQTDNPPSFEPKPITAQIPLVADPITGEVR